MFEENCSLSESFELSTMSYSTPDRVQSSQSERRLSPAIEELIGKLKSLHVATPGPPRTPFPTPIKNSPINKQNFESPNDEDSEKSSINGIARLKKALELRFNSRLSSPNKKLSSPLRRHSVDTNTLKMMLAKENYRRCKLIDLESDIEESPVKRQDNISPIFSRSFNKSRSLLDVSLQATAGSSLQEMDNLSDCESFRDDESISMLEQSFHEVSEVFVALLDSNRALAEKKKEEGQKNVFERKDLVGEEIFREAIDVSFGDLVTTPQKYIIYKSYLKNIEVNLDENSGGNYISVKRLVASEGGSIRSASQTDGSEDYVNIECNNNVKTICRRTDSTELLKLEKSIEVDSKIDDLFKNSKNSDESPQKIEFIKTMNGEDFEEVDDVFAEVELNNSYGRQVKVALKQTLSSLLK